MKKIDKIAFSAMGICFLITGILYLSWENYPMAICNIGLGITELLLVILSKKDKKEDKKEEQKEEK